MLDKLVHLYKTLRAMDLTAAERLMLVRLLQKPKVPNIDGLTKAQIFYRTCLPGNEPMECKTVRTRNSCVIAAGNNNENFFKQFCQL